MNRWSFAQRLALILFLVLALVITTFGAAAYGEVRELSRERAQERLLGVAIQLADGSSRSVAQRLVVSQRLRQLPSIRDITADSAQSIPLAKRRAWLDSAFERTRRPSDSVIVGRELWTPSGERVWSNGPLARADSIAVASVRESARRRDTSALSPFYEVDGRAHVALALPFAEGDAAPSVYVEVFRVSGGPQVEQRVSGLVGERVQLAYANADGSLWLDGTARVQRAPASLALTDSTTTRVPMADGDAQYVAVAAIRGTPWRLLLLQRESTILARPRALRQKFIVIALVLVLVATLVVWWVSQHAQAALESQNRKLHEANAAKARFLGVMSHELRTPLNAITGHAELIAMGVHGPVTPAQEQALSRIQRNKDQLLHLVNDILFFTRLDTQPLEMARERVSLQEQLETLESNLRFEFSRKGVALDVGCTDLVLLADSVRLQQVLVNLVTNAWRFTEAGGRVTVTAAADGGRCRIDVRDTGVGIAPEDLPHIFEPFVQADTSLTRRSGGAGLGLAIVRTLVEAMQGTVAVESRVGEGTSFSCWLPIAPREADTHGPSSTVMHPPVGRAIRV